MPTTVNVTESDLFIVLRAYLLEILGSSVEVLKTQGNRVPMAPGDVVYMTPISTRGLSTTVATFVDDGVGSRNDRRTTQWSVQIDCYGSQAHEWAHIIAGVFRTEYTATLLKYGPLTPLYPGEPRQTSIINAENQWNPRWTLDLHFQANIVVTSPQQFADQLVVDTVEVDSEFPPGA